MGEVALCRHCGKNKQARRKGLCWGCSQKPAVRAMYRSESKHAPRETNDGAGRWTEAELDAMIAEQMANLPPWWDEEGRNVGYGVHGRAKQPKPKQADPPRMSKRCRRAGKK
jgi:hypothetical protein